MVGRTRNNGMFAALGAYYYQDDRIGEVGGPAELLFVRSLAYCAGKLSDGFMTERQVRLYVAVGMDDAEDLCKKLVAIGLWDRDEDRNGYMVRNFLKWNRSHAEISYQRSKDAERKRLERRPRDAAPDSDKSPNGVRPESVTHNTSQHNTSQQDVRPDPSGSGPAGRPREVAPRPIAAAPPDLGPLREKISESAKNKRRPRP